VNPDHPMNPGARLRHAVPTSMTAYTGSGSKLITAERLGLQGAKQPGLLKVCEGLVGQLGRSFASSRGRARAAPKQRTDAIDIILRVFTRLLLLSYWRPAPAFASSHQARS